MIEGKTKTIVWDSNSQPPKNMIWAPNDDEFLEYKNGKWDKSEEVSPAGSGDEFPYEYTCPDDFTITIQPEDWVIVENPEEGYADGTAKIDIGPIYYGTNNHIIDWACNRDSQHDGIAYVSAPWDGSEIIVVFDDNYLKKELNKVEAHWNSFEGVPTLQPLTLNFTNLIFIGQKKTNE